MVNVIILCFEKNCILKVVYFIKIQIITENMVRWVVGLIRGMCYPVCNILHIKEPLLLIGKSIPCGGSGFSLSLSEWYFTICPTPYTRKKNVSSASLNKIFPSFLPYISKTCSAVSLLTFFT